MPWLQGATLNHGHTEAHVGTALQVETEENEESGEPCIVVKLWRADMLGGTMEFTSTCGIVKVDLQTMLLFGMPQQQLQQSGLCRCAHASSPMIS